MYMKRLYALLTFFIFTFLYADPYSKDQIDEFYTGYVGEQIASFQKAGVPVKGFLSVTLINNNQSVADDDNVWIVALGNQPGTSKQCFVSFDTSSGVGTCVPVTSTTNSKDFAYQLSDLPAGQGGRVIQVPYLISGRIYFSVGVNGTWALGDVNDNHSRRRFLHNGEIEATFGYNFAISKLTITPFAGYGFDYSQQRLTAVGFTPIELKYLKYYVPIGIIFNYRFNRNFDLGCKFKWMPYIDRSLDIDVTKGAHWKTKYTNGYYVDLPFTWTFAHSSCVNWGISFIPFFKYSEDGKAFAKTASGMELNLPEQRNLIWGGKLALNIDF